MIKRYNLCTENEQEKMLLCKGKEMVNSRDSMCLFTNLQLNSISSVSVPGSVKRMTRLKPTEN